MTTIVADARIGLIGADRFCSPGFYCRKIFHTKDRGVFGCAGDDRPIARFEDWLIHDGPPPDQIVDDEQEFTALQLHKGKVYRWDAAMRAVEIEDGYFAVGAGGDFALGALDGGRSIFDALLIASRRSETKQPFDFMDEKGNLVSATEENLNRRKRKV